MKDRLDSLGPLLGQIGQALADIAEGDPEGMFFYVELGEGWISQNLFKDEGNSVRYLEEGESHALTDLLYELWYATPEDRRWSVMDYDIADGKFAATFRYPEEVDVEVYDRDDGRRGRALRARYGDKPVIYPPPPEGMFEL